MSIRQGFVLLLLTAGVLVARLPGQVDNDSGSSANTAEGQSATTGSDLNASEVPADSPDGEPPAPRSNNTDVVTLGAHGIMALDKLAGNGLLYGISDSQAYGWVHNTRLPSSSGPGSVVQPYIGLFQAGHRTKTLFQYSPAIDLYDGQRWDGSAFHHAAFDGLHMITDRWTWNFSALGMQGKESVRQIASLAINDGSGAINGLTYALPNDTLTLALGSTGMTWSRTPRQELSFIVADSYTSITHGGGSDTASVRAQISSEVGKHSKWSSYAQVHGYTNQLGRLLIGLGGGYSSTLGEKTTFALEGGPEIATGGRGGRISANFAGSLQQQFLSRTTILLKAERDLMVPFLVQSKWADQFSVRVKEQTSRTTFVEMDASYVRGADVFGGTEHYRGLALGPEFEWRATNTMSLIGAYRYFERENPIPSLQNRHSWILCTFVWQPTTRALER